MLIQYISLKAEIADLEELISKTQKEINKLEKSNCQVSDSVKGTRKDGTYGNIKITGYPYQRCEKAKKIMEQRKEKMNRFRDHLLDLVNEVDDYISNMNDSRMRRMLRHKYLEGMTWVQVAHRMGRRYTPESCRKQTERFLREK